MDELLDLDATAQAELIATGKASATEVVGAAIAQAQSVNESINAIILEQYDRARIEAAGKLPDGPFRGVPLVLKDLGCSQVGEPHHMGTRFLKNIGFVAPKIVI